MYASVVLATIEADKKSHLTSCAHTKQFQFKVMTNSSVCLPVTADSEQHPSSWAGPSSSLLVTQQSHDY